MLKLEIHPYQVDIMTRDLHLYRIQIMKRGGDIITWEEKGDGHLMQLPH